VFENTEGDVEELAHDGASDGQVRKSPLLQQSDPGLKRFAPAPSDSGRQNRPEVGVVAISFHRVATETECLQIGDFVSATPVSRHNVIHFQGAFVRGNAAKLATKFGILRTS